MRHNRIRGPFRNTIDAQVVVKFRFPGLAAGEHEVAYPMLRIIYDYIPGRPAYTPRGEYGPIDPPDPPEISFISAELIDGDGLNPEPREVQEWASEWIEGDGFQAVCDAAEDAHYWADAP